MQQQYDLMSEYLGLNLCFYTLFFVCILGLNGSFLSHFDHQEYQLLKNISRPIYAQNIQSITTR